MNKPMTDERLAEIERYHPNTPYKHWRAECITEIRRLREENERLERINATNKRMWAKIDEHLPPWVGTGKGRITVIDELKAKYERARELLSLCIEDGVGYLQLQNDIRALLDGDDK